MPVMVRVPVALYRFDHGTGTVIVDKTAGPLRFGDVIALAGRPGQYVVVQESPSYVRAELRVAPEPPLGGNLLITRGPEPGVYRHYKGGFYRVLLPEVYQEGSDVPGAVYVTLSPRAYAKGPEGEDVHPSSEDHRLTWRPWSGADGWFTPTADGTPRFVRIT
jgi:hypothetical protein